MDLALYIKKKILNCPSTFTKDRKVGGGGGGGSYNGDVKTREQSVWRPTQLFQGVFCNLC